MQAPTQAPDRTSLVLTDLSDPMSDFEMLKKMPPRMINQDFSSSNNAGFVPKGSFTTTSSASEQNPPKSESDTTKDNRPRLSSRPENENLPSLNLKAPRDSTNDLQLHRQMDLNTRAQIEDMKISYIEQYLLREEKLKQELADQQRTNEVLLSTREAHWKEILDEKEKKIQIIHEQHQREIGDYKKRLQDKDEFYVGQMSAMEKQFQQQQIDLDNRWKIRVKTLEDQINMEKERHALTERAKLEAKEKALQLQHEKKVKKFTKQIESVMEHYKAKELMIQGALEEARREIINLQANHTAAQQVAREELLLKDKRLVEIQQYLDETDEFNRRADEWKSLATELATIVIHACSTVEELPAELWTSTTPGLFTSVWDELRGQQTGSNVRTGYGRVTVDDSVRSYSEKKKDCVVAKRAELAKCLKYSKVVHDRVRVDEMRPRSASRILS